MAEWYVRLLNQEPPNNVVGEYSLRQPICDLRNSEPGGFTGEIALGQKRRGSTTLGITRDQFAPYRTLWQLYRQSSGSGKLISEGMITSVNLNRDRDTILIAGKDWKHYLQRRIYPFQPKGYVEYDEEAPEGYWDKWPKKWVTEDGDPVPVSRIIRDLIASMRTGRPIDVRSAPYTLTQATATGVPTITFTGSITGGPTATYKIYPGDQTTIYDHINTLAEMNDGFEWDILPGSRNFRMWQPKKYANDEVVAYFFEPSDDPNEGMVIDFDWTNEGPDGTYLLGLGATDYKVGDIWKYEPALEQFGRYDLVYDYGKIADEDVILRKLKDQNDLWPQKKLTFTLLNPEFLPRNFYTGDMPRGIIGNSMRITKDFPPYHKVDAYFQVNAVTWRPDESSNEVVEFELMMIYEPETGMSGGLT